MHYLNIALAGFFIASFIHSVIERDWAWHGAPMAALFAALNLAVVVF